MRRSLSVLAFLVLWACGGPNYYDAQKLDTIEAYETFLTAKPNDSQAYPAKMRLQELYLEKAQETRSLQAYDEFLAKFPDSLLKEKAQLAREEFLYAWAKETATRESLQQYLDEYPRGKKKRKTDVRKRIGVLDYIAYLDIGSVTIVPINLAENPEGPLDGYAVSAPVQNKGKKTIALLELELAFVNNDGNVMLTKRWPVVAPRLPGNLPVEEEFKIPMKPGETRTLYYTTWDPGTKSPTGDKAPGGWSKEVRLAATHIKFVD
jgi:tetratricopeptide (TPR) repeat protein